MTVGISPLPVTFWTCPRVFDTTVLTFEAVFETVFITLEVVSTTDPDELRGAAETSVDAKNAYEMSERMYIVGLE